MLRLNGTEECSVRLDTTKQAGNDTEIILGDRNYMICKEIEILCCEYNHEEFHKGSNGDVIVHYENMVTLTKHMSGIIEVCFKLKTSRPKFSIEAQEDHDGDGFLGIYYWWPDYDLGVENSEVLEIEWKAERLGDLRDFRILTEQCKDEVVFVMVPWKILGLR